MDFKRKIIWATALDFSVFHSSWVVLKVEGGETAKKENMAKSRGSVALGILILFLAYFIYSGNSNNILPAVGVGLVGLYILIKDAED